MGRLLRAVLPIWLAATAGMSTGIPDNISSFELLNGLRVVVVEDNRTPAVNHTLWIRAGATDDPPGRSGLAHFVEHMMFKGAGNLADGEYDRTIRMLGGSSHAATTQEYTFYQARVSAENLETVMALEAERMKGIPLVEEIIAIEREVILEERNQRVDSSPGALFQEQLSATLYLNHPYMKPVIGWQHEIRAIEMEDIQVFYEQYYRPDNAVLVVSGNLDPERVLAMANEHFGVLEPAGSLPGRRDIMEPPHLSERRLEMSDDRVSNPVLTRRYIAPGDFVSDLRQAASLVLLSELLGGSSYTSVLVQEMQLESSLAVYSNAVFSGTYGAPMSFTINVVPAPDVTIHEVETRLDEVLDEFLAGEIDLGKWHRILKQIEYAQIYELDNSMHTATRYGRGLASGMSIEQVHEWPDLIKSIEPGEVMNTAVLLFDRSRAVTGWLLGSQDQ